MAAMGLPTSLRPHTHFAGRNAEYEVRSSLPRRVRGGKIEAYDLSLKPAELLPRLFLGCARDASLKDVRERGYGAVLNVAPVETHRQVRDGAVYDSLDGIAYHSIDARDQLDYDLIGRHADEALAFLAAREGPPAELAGCAAARPPSVVGIQGPSRLSALFSK